MMRVMRAYTLRHHPGSFVAAVGCGGSQSKGAAATKPAGDMPPYMHMENCKNGAGSMCVVEECVKYQTEHDHVAQETAEQNCPQACNCGE